MRKALVGAAVLALLGVGLAACTPVKSPGSDPKDVLVVGDSIAGGLGCWVFGEMGQIGAGPDPNCGGHGQPGITAANGWLGACTISGGWLQLFNHTALNTPNCWNYGEIWQPLVERHNPKLVILWTSGWEIVNRWGDLPPGCDPGNILLCVPPADRQWGSLLDPVFGNPQLAAAQQAYRSNLHNAINVLSSRGAKVLVLNSPYYNPPLPAPPSLFINPEFLPGVPGLDAVWYEPHVLPLDPVPAHPTTLFAPSKIKVENFNATLDAIRINDYGGGTGNVQFFDIWRYLSPKVTPIDLPVLNSRDYSQVLCAHPNSEQPPVLTCPLDLVNARYAIDGGHITPAGYDRIVEPYLMPKVREMLGI